MAVEEQQLTDHAARVEALLAEIESFPDPAVREQVVGIVQGLLALYGAGLTRIIESVGRSEERSPAAMLAALASDDLVAHLLLLHDLHPIDLEARVTRALDEVRPQLQSKGGDVELLQIHDGTARVRLHGSCRACPSSADTLRSTVETALYKAAPDLLGVVAEAPESAVDPGQGSPAAFVPLSALSGSGLNGGRAQALSPAAPPTGGIHD